MNNESHQPITVTATVNAPAEVAWRRWNAPEDIQQWCYATPEWHAPRAENNLREGGKFSTTMAARDGSVSFDFAGEYTEVKPNKSIRYTLEDGRRVSIDFEENDGRTTVTQTFDPDRENPADMQRAGWQAILDNFKNYVETVGT